MKLCLFLLLAFQLSATGRGYSQHVSIHVTDAPLLDVIKELRQQSGYAFLFNAGILHQAGNVTISLKDVYVEDALKAILKNKALSYSIKERIITIKAKDAPAKRKVLLLQDTIRGTVTDSMGRPLAGVAVRIAGTKIGTNTNGKGHFTIPNSIDGAQVEFFLIGFAPLRLPSTNLPINIILHESVSKLDETVVIAYGTTTQRLNTGNVSSVRAIDIERQPISNPIASLQGRVPGLMITQTNGLPGSGFNLQIRGNNSISQGTEPLIIIDGVPFDPTFLAQTVSSGSLNVNNPLNTLNPGDIESIEVLKDASATSIYGSRGANGVILITTKKAQSGDLSININSYLGWGKVTNLPKLLDGLQYRNIRRQAIQNDGEIPNENNASDVVSFDTTIVNNWPQTLFGNTAHTNNSQLRIAGGSPKTKFTSGINYYRETTVFPETDATTRKSINFSVTHSTPSDKLRVLLNTSYSFNRSNLIPQDITQFQNYTPYGFKLREANGNLVWDDAARFQGNPLSYTVKSYDGTTDMFAISTDIRYQLPKGLSARINGGYNLLDFSERSISPISSNNPDHGVLGNASFGHNKVRNWSIEPQLEYTQNFAGKLSLNVLLGTSYQENSGRKELMNGSEYITDALIETIEGAGSILASNDYNLYRYSALFGRVDINYDNTYLLSLTSRRDGSSRFGIDNRFANFASLGAGWLFSNLNFMREKIPQLDYGKIRFSYGTSGNDQIGNYRYLDTYTPSTGFFYQQSLSLFPTRLYNSHFSWEQFRKLEVAIEIGLFKEKIYSSVAYYNNRSDNQLVYYSLPRQTGFSNVMMNYPGVVENSGWELELRTSNIKRKIFEWSTNINFSIPRNKLIDFPGLQNSSYSNTLVIGHPLNVFIGYKFLGVDPETGSYRIEDTNGDGQLNTEDYQPLGTTDPRFFGGLQNTLSYKRFTFDFLLQFVKQQGRHQIYGNSTPLGAGGNILADALNYWKNPGDIVPYAKPTQAYGTDLYNSYTLTAFSDAVLTDASFLRLKNASLSYTFNNSILKAKSFRSISISVLAQNLFTITNYLGADPENQSAFVLPPLRMIASQIKVIF